MRSDRDWLRDILDCTERIARHEQTGEPGDLVLDAILHNLVVIGEAVRGLSEGCRKCEPDVRWSAIVGMRNLLTHEYFRIDYSDVRDVIETHLPDLAAAARRLLSALGETPSSDDQKLSDRLPRRLTVCLSRALAEIQEYIVVARTVIIEEVQAEFGRLAEPGSRRRVVGLRIGWHASDLGSGVSRPAPRPAEGSGQVWVRRIGASTPARNVTAPRWL